MRWSLVSSLGLHAAILVAALVVLPNPNPYEVKPVEAIQVDISRIAPDAKKMAMVKEQEQPAPQPKPKKAVSEAKTDPKAKVAEEAKKVAKEPEAAPPPEPKADEPKKAEAKPEEPAPDQDQMAALLKKTVAEPPKKKEEPAKADASRKAEKKPEKKPEKKEKKKPKLDVDQMEAFLNKIDEDSTAPIESSDLDGAPAKGEANLQGTDDQLAATVVQALVQRIRECWSVPAGAREANVVVKMHFRLGTDGRVEGVPEVMNGSSDPLFDATARSAVAAVLECQAYDFLPREQYDLWKDLIINFNPNMMFDT